MDIMLNDTSSNSTLIKHTCWENNMREESWVSGPEDHTMGFWNSLRLWTGAHKTEQDHTMGFWNNLRDFEQEQTRQTCKWKEALSVRNTARSAPFCFHCSLKYLCALDYKKNVRRKCVPFQYEIIPKNMFDGLKLMEKPSGAQASFT